MQHILLSDHTADQLERRQTERKNNYDAAVAEYTGRLQVRQARIDSLVEMRTQAKEQGGHLRAAGYACEVLVARLGMMFGAWRDRPVMAQEGLDDVLWKNGHEGEERVRGRLGQYLDDSWTWLGGYRNPGGEIDALLAGPSGIYAMEIKNYRGVIECDGDEWWRDKYDNWGHLVRRHEPITDRGGRGPSKQVNDPADRLEAFLARTVGAGCRISRVVVFSDETATIGAAKNMTVDGIYLLRDWDVQATLNKSQIRWTPEETDRIVRQIVRDHGYWERKRICRHAPDPTNAGPAPTPAPTT
jgi:hypothetical protein